MGIYDNTRSMMLAHMNNAQGVAFTREMIALWEQAWEQAQTEEQRQHVEKSMIQAYYFGLFYGDAMERKEYQAKVYEYCEKYGITHFREGTLIDFSKADKMGSLK